MNIETENNLAIKTLVFCSRLFKCIIDHNQSMKIITEDVGVLVPTFRCRVLLIASLMSSQLGPISCTRTTSA